MPNKILGYKVLALPVSGFAAGEVYYVQPSPTDDVEVYLVGLDLAFHKVSDLSLKAQSKSFTIESPTNSENIGLWKTDGPITITQISAVSVGSTPSLTYSIRYGSDRSVAGTEVVTGGSTTTSVSSGDDVTTFDSASIPADNWIKLTTTAATGTIDQVTITIHYTI